MALYIAAEVHPRQHGAHLLEGLAPPSLLFLGARARPTHKSLRVSAHVSARDSNGVLAYIVMAYIVAACVVMAHIVMAYMVMAYIVVA